MKLSGVSVRVFAIPSLLYGMDAINWTVEEINKLYKIK